MTVLYIEIAYMALDQFGGLDQGEKDIHKAQASAAVAERFGEEYRYVVGYIQRLQLTTEEEVQLFIEGLFSNHKPDHFHTFDRGQAKDISFNAPALLDEIQSIKYDEQFLYAIKEVDQLGNNRNAKLFYSADSLIFTSLIAAYVIKMHREHTGSDSDHFGTPPGPTRKEKIKEAYNALRGWLTPTPSLAGGISLRSEAITETLEH